MDKYVIFHIDGGCGKNIVATSVVKSIKAAYPEHKLIVVTAWPEVLGKQICDWIDNNFAWYQKGFGYTK